MAKQKDNYLDYVPKHNSLFECRENKKGHVEVKVHNKGIFNRIAQRLCYFIKLLHKNQFIVYMNKINK